MPVAWHSERWWDWCVLYWRVIKVCRQYVIGVYRNVLREKILYEFWYIRTKIYTRKCLKQFSTCYIIQTKMFQFCLWNIRTVWHINLKCPNTTKSKIHQRERCSNIHTRGQKCLNTPNLHNTGIERNTLKWGKTLCYKYKKVSWFIKFGSLLGKYKKLWKVLPQQTKNRKFLFFRLWKFFLKCKFFKLGARKFHFLKYEKLFKSGVFYFFKLGKLIPEM